jgi:hypothetical protein
MAAVKPVKEAPAITTVLSDWDWVLDSIDPISLRSTWQSK